MSKTISFTMILFLFAITIRGAFDPTRGLTQTSEHSFQQIAQKNPADIEYISVQRGLTDFWFREIVKFKLRSERKETYFAVQELNYDRIVKQFGVRKRIKNPDSMPFSVRNVCLDSTPFAEVMLFLVLSAFAYSHVRSRSERFKTVPTKP